MYLRSVVKILDLELEVREILCTTLDDPCYNFLPSENWTDRH